MPSSLNVKTIKFHFLVLALIGITACNKRANDMRPSEADVLAAGKQLCDNTVLVAR